MVKAKIRAKQYASENEKPLLPVPPQFQHQVAECASSSSAKPRHRETSTSSLSSTSSSSSDSSNSSSNSRRSSEAPAVVDGGMLGCIPAAQVSGLSEAGGSTGSAQTKARWVSPDGRLLHVRVDLGTYHMNKPEYALLCKPQHTKYQRHANFKQGDDAQSAAQTNLRWCEKCAKSL